MNNLLTKIYNYVKSLLPNDQEPAFLSNALTDHKVSAWDEASVISSSCSMPVEDEKPLPDDKDKESDFIIEAFRNLTPDYLLIVAEMRNLLNSDIKRIIFHALATRLSIDEVADHLGLTHQQVSSIFQEAITDIGIQSGFVRNYLDNGVRKDLEIENLKSDIQLLKERITKMTTKQPSKKKGISKISVARQKELLGKPLTECLDLQKATIRIFKLLDIETLEELLIFASANGLSALKKQRKFGDSSFMKLQNELIRKGIFDKDGRCELYKYITLPEPTGVRKI